MFRKFPGTWMERCVSSLALLTSQVGVLTSQSWHIGLTVVVSRRQQSD